VTTETDVVDNYVFVVSVLRSVCPLSIVIPLRTDRQTGRLAAAAAALRALQCSQRTVSVP